jgi:hypothetical protein
MNILSISYTNNVVSCFIGWNKKPEIYLILLILSQRVLGYIVFVGASLQMKGHISYALHLVIMWPSDKDHMLLQ